MDDERKEAIKNRNTVIFGGLILGAILFGAPISDALHNNLSLDSFRMIFHVLGASIVVIFIAVDNNPLKWWRIFVGTEVRIASKPWIGLSGHEMEQRNEELQHWLKSSSIGPYYVVNRHRIRFLRKSDAALFKLTWG